MKPRWHYLTRGPQSPYGDWARRSAIDTRTMLTVEEQQARFALLDQRDRIPDDEFNARWKQDVAPLEAASDEALTTVRRAGWGRGPWPAEIAWVQDYGVRRWPPLFCAMSMGFELIDQRGEEFLRRVVPDGEWSTCDGLILDRDWQPVITHNVLVVEQTVPMIIWKQPGEPGHPAIPDDLPDGAWIARHATRDGETAESVFFSPEAMANISKERRIPGMELVEIPWASELEAQAQAGGWKRIE